ncbi:MAG: hypothetical protein ACOZAO_02040 [Patescibacteria group bacterium]
MKLSSIAALNILLKLLLILSFVIALFFDLPQLEGKGMLFRAPFFILGAFIVPIASVFKKPAKYPFFADIYLTLPFLLDTLGNIFGLFDSIVVFDDVIHMVNWVFIVMAFQALKLGKRSLLQGMLFGVGLIIIWEILEWTISVDGFGILNGLNLSLADTLGDLFTSSLGSLVGAYFGMKHRSL